MNNRGVPNLDRVLEAFLRDGPSEAPGRVLFGALDDVARTSQRRRSIFSWRYPVSLPVRLGVVAILVVLLAGAVYAGSQLLPAPSPVPSASPTAGPAASPSSQATPSVTPTLAPTLAATPAVSASSLVHAALKQLDKAIAAARTGGLTLSDQNTIFQHEDDMTSSLDGGDLPSAQAAGVVLSDLVTQRAATVAAPLRQGLLDAVASITRMLTATPYVSGPLAAGVYFPQTFTPAAAVSLPDGWSRVFEDTEVLALQKGAVTLAFDHAAVGATADDVAKVVGKHTASDLPTPPVPTTLGHFIGFSGELTGGGTLWITASLQAHDAAPGSRILVWVVEVNGRTLTVDVDGPPADVDALRSEIAGILATLEST